MERNTILSAGSGLKTSTTSYARERRICFYTLLGWAVVAVIAVATHVFAYLPVAAAQAVIAAQMLIFLLVLLFAPGIREYLFTRDLRLLTLFHLWRALPGALFLYYYYSLHRLPWNFAVPGGYGDIVIAVTAPLAAQLPASASRLKSQVLLAWHVLGFLDLAGVVRAGLVNGRHNPEAMRALTHFPLSLLPAILVALTFVVHIIAIVQLARRRTPER
jgi:hypothetical protein